MYGLWLFKEIETEYGYCKVEIYRRGYNGSQIEIGALAANSLAISLENLGEITAPIGKSVCSFEIIDTDQINYDDFFTPDATAYKVVVSSRGGSGAYVTRWSGYITPDFFAENLSYRTPISISARDNIGYLNDVDFDLDAATVTIRQLITSAFARIAEDYPMNLEFVTAKQTAEGILAIDATISTLLLKEMSWGEALETILHDLGLQMRWVDNNTIAVMDLSQIPEYYGIQEFNFIQSSGYREILPAWRQLSQSQDYGLRENFFEGWLREDNISYVKTIVMRPPNATNWTTDIAYYVPNNWGVARDIYTISPQYYGAKFGKKIYFTGVSEEYPTTTYLSWRQQIQSSNTPMKIAFNAFNSVLYPSEKYSNVDTPSMRRLVAYNPKDAFHGEKKGEFLQIGLKINILLHSGVKSYVLRDNWVDIESAGDWQLNFTLPKVELSYVEGGQATATEPTEQEVTINIATIPYDGEIELRIYGWYIVDKHNYWEDDWTLTDYQFDWLKCLSYINEPIFSYNNDEPATGQDASILVNSLHNVKNSQDYIFGEVPLDNGGVNAYAGGLYKADGNELVGFQRNAEGVNYNLLELVGREAIHFNKKNYNKLSGTIKNLDKEPLMFNRLFVREGKTYAPFAYSLNVISNEMKITTMQEVEPYETASFTQIDSEVTTGGATVGGGNNTVLQYSEDAGNAKRVYELDTATEEQKKDAYLLIDSVGFPEAKKVHTSDLFNDLGLSLVEQDGKIWLRSEHDFFSEGEVSSGGASGSNPDEPSSSIVSVEQILTEGTPIANVIVNGVDNIIYAPKNSGGGGGVADSIDWANVYNKPTTLGGYGITDALPLSGGTIEGTVYNKIAGYAYRWGEKDNCFVGSNTDVNLYIGTSDATYINLYTSMSERMRITATGNILIGTPTDTGHKLTVEGSTLIKGSNGYGVLIGAGANTIDAWRDGGNTDLWLNWQSTGHIKMVNGGGNVLIGTTTDNGAKLQVNGSALFVNSYFGNDTGVHNPQLGSLHQGSIGLAVYNSKYGLFSWTNATTGLSSMQVGRMDGNSTVYNLALQPLGGNVLIGTTSDDGANKLQIAGRVRITSPDWASYDIVRSYYGSSSVGGMDGQGAYFSHTLNGVTAYMYLKAGTGLTVHSNFTATGDVTSGSSASDMRLKDIVCNDYDAVSIIKNLSTFKYKWNSTAKSLTDCFSKDNYEHFGLSAQEVEKVSGYLVSNFNYGEGREYLTLKKDELVPVLVQAVKQLLTRIEILEGK